MGGRTHIIFVNGSYKNDKTEIGRLIHDFKCSNANDMFIPVLAERVRSIKENPREVEKVCQVIEDVRKESEFMATLKGIINLMIKLNMSAEEAMDVMEVPEDHRPMYLEAINARLKRQIA